MGLAELGISNLDMGRAEVEVTSGGAVLSYASVADNRIGDAVYLPAQKSGKTEQIVAAVAKTKGGYGTDWVSDLTLANPGNQPTEYTLTLHQAAGGRRQAEDGSVAQPPSAVDENKQSQAGARVPHYSNHDGRVMAGVRDGGNPPLRSDSVLDLHTSRTTLHEPRLLFTLEPGHTILIADVVGTVFGLENTAGSLHITSDGPVFATSRTYNRTERGTYGQGVPAGDRGQGIGVGETGHILQLANTEEYRTNLGFAEAAGLATELEIRIYDLSGSLLLTSALSLQPSAWRQVGLEALGLSMTLPAARAEITVLSGGAVYAYASVVDNRSGDAIFIPAHP